MSERTDDGTRRHEIIPGRHYLWSPRNDWRASADIENRVEVLTLDQFTTDAARLPQDPSTPTYSGSDGRHLPLPKRLHPTSNCASSTTDVLVVGVGPSGTSGDTFLVPPTQIRGDWDDCLAEALSAQADRGSRPGATLPATHAA